MNTLRAHGKLLVSAEYMVLHGSSALALPLKRGQILQPVRTEDPGRFSWKAGYGNRTWFRGDFHPDTLEILESTHRGKAAYLQRLLKACLDLNPSFATQLIRWDVETRLEFSPRWGFGSSSTLTSLLARWAGIDPMDLHFRISSGSGYDVACATAKGPILYTLGANGPQYTPVNFHPPFASQLHFIWLGSKKSTAGHLAALAGQLQPALEDIHYFSTLTRAMLAAGSLRDFRELMEEHELRLAELTGQERVAESRFPGLRGSVKSLGAWGGDFVMIATEQDPETLYNYLDKLGLDTRFRFKDLVYGG
jgi:mevalonate kinase